MSNILRKSRDSPLKLINANHCILIMEKNNALNCEQCIESMVKLLRTLIQLKTLVIFLTARVTIMIKSSLASEQESKKVGVIQAFYKEIGLGNYEIQIMLQFYESIFLSTVLFNCQSWTNLTDTHIESLQTLQMKYLKQTMCVPYSTPNKGTLLELGILPINDVINCRKLLFLHHILNLKEDDPVLKLYKEQNTLPFEKHWANEVSRLREHCNINL